MSIERRRHARIATDIECTLSVSDGPTRAGTMRDVSLVGAQVVGAAEVAAELETLELSVGATEGYPALRVSARVMYHRPREAGIVSGLQFVDLDADRHRAVTAFVDAVLGGGGGGKRAHPRVQHRVDVVCQTKTRAKAVLQDISRGGVRVVLEQEVDEGEDISVSVTVGKLPTPLELSGKVVRVKLDAEGRRHAGIRLDPIEGAANELLAKLMKRLVAG